jgi:hypothetical protein
MVTPDAVIGDADALLTFSVGADERTINVEDRLGEEGRRLLCPDPHSRFVNCVHQGDDIGLGETTAEIFLCSWVGKSLSAQGIEINFIVASQLDVLDSLSASHDIECDIQEMVRLMIGPVFLQDVEVVVDVTDQANPPREQQQRTDSSRIEALDPIGELVVNVTRGDHRLFAIWRGTICNTVEDSPLSISQTSANVFAGTSAGAFRGFLLYTTSALSLLNLGVD